MHINLKKEIYRFIADDEPRPIRDILKDDDGTKDLIPKFKKFPQALCGQIIYKDIYVAGSEFGKCPEPEEREGQAIDLESKTIYFRWNSLANKNSESVTWKGSPSVYIDDELKTSILFRVKNLSYNIDDSIIGEYYRFAAEVEPVKQCKIEKKISKFCFPKKLLSFVINICTQAITTINLTTWIK